MKKIIGGAVAALIAGALVLGVSLPANAWWYNTAKNVGTLTIKVINTDGKYFSIASGNSASDVQYVYVGPRQRVAMQPVGAGWTTWPCNLPSQSGYVLVGSYRLNTINLKVTNC
jgi:hypothetical protein